MIPLVTRDHLHGVSIVRCAHILLYGSHILLRQPHIATAAQTSSRVLRQFPVQVMSLLLVLLACGAFVLAAADAKGLYDLGKQPQPTWCAEST